uniref:Small hydrophobic protein n=1 Tax=Steinernema glaseri TaxID=37863 RepID=A0A1I7Z5Q1_9BILA
MRIRAFMEEYSRMIQLLDDINAMKESMFRMEMLMMIMVILLVGTIGLSTLVFICKTFCCNPGGQEDRAIYYSEPTAMNHQRATFSLEKGINKSPVKSTSCELPRGSVT